MASKAHGFAIWITGLPASGKSVVTAALIKELARRGISAEVLNSDNLRTVFTSPQQYSDQDREYFYRSIAFIGKVLTKNGIPVIFDATANRRAWRDYARRSIPLFLEIYVNTPLEVCIARDPKGIYRAAKEGQAQRVPGIQAPYEPPIEPDLVIDGETEPPDEAAARITALLQQRGLIR